MDLEPVSLGLLAAAMRDGTLLDVRSVDVGTLERVAVRSLTVTRLRDYVEFVQRVGDARASIEVDAESIRWMRPTVFMSDDEIKSIPTLKLESALADRKGANKMWLATEQAVAEHCQCTPDELRSQLKDWDAKYIHTRYLVMLTFRLFGVETDLEITRRYDYSSVQPMMSARHAWKDRSDVVERMNERAKELLAA